MIKYETYYEIHTLYHENSYKKKQKGKFIIGHNSSSDTKESI